jgi:hypothetical protein
MSDAEHEMVVETEGLRTQLDGQAAELRAWRRAAARLLVGPHADAVADALRAEGLDLPEPAGGTRQLSP